MRWGIAAALGLLLGVAWQVKGHRTLALAFDGNSLTAGQGAAAGQDYPTQVARDLRIYGAYLVVNSAVGAQTTGQMVARAATEVDARIDRPVRYRVLVAWEISNDLYFGVTPQAAFERFVSYCRARKAAGWRVVALTVLPRENAGTPGDFEESRQVVNALMRRHWRDFADGLADVGDVVDGRYFVDGVHLNGEGYKVVAGIVQKAILGLMPNGAAGLFWQNVFGY